MYVNIQIDLYYIKDIYNEQFTKKSLHIIFNVWNSSN